MTSPPPKRALDRGALIPPREAPAPFPDSAFVAPDRALDVACHALERRSPAYSARIVLVRWQRLLLVAGIVSSLAGLVFLPGPTGVVLVGLLAAFQLWALVFRLLV
ncbi:MAG: N-acetylglucosaminyltransferase, partial [Arachnia propionica]